MRFQQRSDRTSGGPVGRHRACGESSAQFTKAFERSPIILHRRMVIREFGGSLFARFPNVRPDRAGSIIVTPMPCGCSSIRRLRPIAVTAALLSIRANHGARSWRSQS